MSKDTKKNEAKNQEPVAAALERVNATLPADVVASTPEERQKLAKARPGFEALALQLAKDLAKMGAALPDQDIATMLESIEQAEALLPAREQSVRIAEKIEDTYQRHRGTAYKIFAANYRFLALLAETNGEAAQAVKSIEDFLAIGPRPKKAEVSNTDVEVKEPIPKSGNG